MLLGVRLLAVVTSRSTLLTLDTSRSCWEVGEKKPPSDEKQDNTPSFASPNRIKDMDESWKCQTTDSVPELDAVLDTVINI